MSKTRCPDNLLYTGGGLFSFARSNAGKTEFISRSTASCHMVLPFSLSRANACCRVCGLSNNISIYNIKVLKENTVIGFLSFLINYNELNVKYFLVKEDSYYNLCVDALIDNLVKLKRNYIFTYDSKLANNISKRYATIFSYKVQKEALIHKELNIKNKKIKNRDGHFY